MFCKERTPVRGTAVVGEGTPETVTDFPILDPRLTHKKEPSVRRLSLEATNKSPQEKKSESTNRSMEAKSCVASAKSYLSQSRNLKSEIKEGVTKAINRLYELVKEAEPENGLGKDKKKVNRQGEVRVMNLEKDSEIKGIKELNKKLEENMKLVEENNERMKKLKEVLERETFKCDGAKNSNLLRDEVRELRQITEETGRKLSTKQGAPSYAEVLAGPDNKLAALRRKPLTHSVIVASTSQEDSSDQVLGKVREALDARTSGLRVHRVRKVRNQKVVLSCSSREEFSRMTAKLAQNKTLVVEEAKSKDPLVILKNVLACNSDEQILQALATQNTSLLVDLRPEEYRAVVKYRRRARNPQENHVVLQVSPKLWQVLTLHARIHVDLQYVLVEDQSPLIQCTRCLTYGHGRKLCKQPEENCNRCNYCGSGKHLRAECAKRLSGDPPACLNCFMETNVYKSHSIYDDNCPVRQRWEAIARSSVAYC